LKFSDGTSGGSIIGRNIWEGKPHGERGSAILQRGSEGKIPSGV